jgi:hypothetical protein
MPVGYIDPRALRPIPKLFGNLVNPALSAPAPPDNPLLAVFRGKRNATLAGPLCNGGRWVSKYRPLFLVVEWDGVEFEAVIDQPIAQLAGYFRLQLLDFL